MGGQACILYGAAEFSRDADLAVLASPQNLQRLGNALAELRAEAIAVPPFEAEYLERGHCVHFRCHHREALGIRLDVMSKLRGVDPFPTLWKRRTTLAFPDGNAIDLLSLPDLVASKKTQRDKDWPMIRRLVEANYARYFTEPTEQRIKFWLQELRTPLLLIECVQKFPGHARRTATARPAVRAAIAGDEDEISAALFAEQAREGELDRAYWAPLRAELERLRHQ